MRIDLPANLVRTLGSMFMGKRALNVTHQKTFFHASGLESRSEASAQRVDENELRNNQCRGMFMPHDPMSLSHNHRIQMDLARYNRRRLTPEFGAIDWKNKYFQDFQLSCLEEDYIQSLNVGIQPWLSTAPANANQFVLWFESLRDNGPDQHYPVFDYLDSEASLDEMRWFLQQEVGGEAGFDDLVALAQIKLPARLKVELARNYWDEMGRGSEKGMHGPLLIKLARELSIAEESDRVIPEALALSNLMSGLALNRRYAFHLLGALGCELEGLPILLASFDA